MASPRPLTKTHSLKNRKCFSLRDQKVIWNVCDLGKLCGLKLAPRVSYPRKSGSLTFAVSTAGGRNEKGQSNDTSSVEIHVKCVVPGICSHGRNKGKSHDQAKSQLRRNSLNQGCNSTGRVLMSTKTLEFLPGLFSFLIRGLKDRLKIYTVFIYFQSKEFYLIIVRFGY